jgi:hypothetical protein
VQGAIAPPPSRNRYHSLVRPLHAMPASLCSLSSDCRGSVKAIDGKSPPLPGGGHRVG